MREAGSLRPLDDRRVPGRARLERRIRGLLLAVHRFGRGRAATPADRDFAARAIDGLSQLLEDRRRDA